MHSNHDGNSLKTVVLYLVLAYMIKPVFEDPIKSARVKEMVLLVNFLVFKIYSRSHYASADLRPGANDSPKAYILCIVFMKSCHLTMNLIALLNLTAPVSTKAASISNGR